MPKPGTKPNRVIRSPQVMEALIARVRPRLPWAVQHTRITEEDLLYVLSYASVHRINIDAACTELDQAPSANRFREVLAVALPARPSLQRGLNTILRQQLPRPLLKGKRSYVLALDVTLIPYHGQPERDEKEVVRGAPKAGTTHFHGYATVSIVHSQRRYVVALRFMQAGENMVTSVRALLKRVKRLGICVRRVYLDKGFCATDVFQTLARRGLSDIIPIPVRGKASGVRRLFVGPASYWTAYTFNAGKPGAYTVQAASVRRYCKGRYGRHGVKWFAYAVAGLPAGMSPRQVFERYRKRFGIESSYRQMNDVRACTTTRSPAIRLLLVGLAFILVNLYVALRDRLATATSGRIYPARSWLSLRRLAFLLGRVVEQQFGVAGIVQHRHSTVLS